MKIITKTMKYLLLTFLLASCIKQEPLTIKTDQIKDGTFVTSRSYGLSYTFDQSTGEIDNIHYKGVRIYPAPRWINALDSIPPDPSGCLVFVKSERGFNTVWHYAISSYWAGINGWDVDHLTGDGWKVKVSHWMPLPDRPGTKPDTTFHWGND